MANVVLGCDSNGNNEKWQNTIKKGLEDAGYSVEKLPIAPGPFADYSYAKNGKNPKGKIGVYLMAASLVSVTDAYLASPGFDYNYFVIRGDASKLIQSENDFNTKKIPKDHHGDCTDKLCDKWQGKTYVEINDLAKDKCKCVFASNPEEGVDALLNAFNGISPSQSNSDNGNEDNDEEEWDDKDNFTPHKGKIMEIKPYKYIASISFDKSYDSPTGSGNVDIIYSSKDYRYIYKGVAMKLKLRRSCDSQWSATGLEEPNYDENEKFLKEHIPTDELLKELGLPNYRKQNKILKDTSTGDSSMSDDTNMSSDSDTSSSSSSSSSNTSSNRSSSSSSGGSNRNSGSRSSSSKSNAKSSLSRKYINSLTPSQAQKMSKNTNKYDTVTIKALRRRAMGLYW